VLSSQHRVRLNETQHEDIGTSIKHLLFKVLSSTRIAELQVRALKEVLSPLSICPSNQVLDIPWNTWSRLTGTSTPDTKRAMSSSRWPIPTQPKCQFHHSAMMESAWCQSQHADGRIGRPILVSKTPPGFPRQLIHRICRQFPPVYCWDLQPQYHRNSSLF
jgi:hypothetical protein